ncbi:MAG: hypothetical protein KF799_08530 [Bdellovibrionales bacterium]|nr:hypothetical protein [Bdellovibrionales bacterium]
MGVWLAVAVLGGLLGWQGGASFSLLRWLPYSSLEFFVFLIPLFLAVGLLKSRLKSERVWLGLLQVLNAGYLLVLFPDPLALVFSATWFYAILQWRKRDKRWTWLQGALLLLPLLLKHNVHELQFWGLSYATFRAFHLFMDDALLVDFNFRRLFFFVFYFPALLAGPIDRWPRFKEALLASWKTPVVDFWPQASFWLALGLLQKFVLAEAVRRYWLPGTLNGASEWVAAFYSYPLYLYLDFAGYSAMAIGFSLLVGVSLPVNFNKPFLASDPQDFWRRFHITLGEWLRDYFFKPLYRHSARWPGLSPLMRQNIALFLTFLLMGLWNGPRKQFVISGALFGIYSVVHNTFVYYAKQKGRAPATRGLKLWLSRLLMVHLAALALFIFSGMPFRG